MRISEGMSIILNRGLDGEFFREFLVWLEKGFRLRAGGCMKGGED